MTQNYEIKKVQCLEDYITAMTIGVISMRTICGCHEEAIEAGILTDDMETRAKIMIWDIRRAVDQYKQQIDNVLEYISDDFCIQKEIEKMRTK